MRVTVMVTVRIRVRARVLRVFRVKVRASRVVHHRVSPLQGL